MLEFSDEVGQLVRTIYGDALVKRYIQSSNKDCPKYEVSLPYGVAYLHPSSMVHSLPLDSGKTNFVRQVGSFEALKETFEGTNDVYVRKGCFQMFGTERIYIFLRFYCTILSTLREVKMHINARSLEKEEESEDLKSREPRSAVKSTQTKESTTTNLRKKYQGYEGYVSAVNDHLKGELCLKTFETICRYLSDSNVAKFALVPRLLLKCAGSMIRVFKEGCFLPLLDYSRITRMVCIIAEKQTSTAFTLKLFLVYFLYSSGCFTTTLTLFGCYRCRLLPYPI